nr:ABC transporter permease [Virgibacillus sp.]
MKYFVNSNSEKFQQFNAFITILAVCMAMVGGAYWPIEIVESNFLIAISKINPITYGMEILHGVVNYGYSLEELFYPMSILLLMGIVMIGVGIHLTTYIIRAVVE